jgi:hypothetical protein
MDGGEIDRITRDVAPLTDMYPKRLSDEFWDDEANQRFAFTYLAAPAALERFRRSSLTRAIWPEALGEVNSGLESFFSLRESRYLSGAIGSNELAELDLYLRHSRLRIPVLEVLGSDGFRLSIAERVAKRSESTPLETMSDLVAGALAQRDISRAIRLLENKKDHDALNSSDMFLLTYLYCLNGDVNKAEALAAANAATIKKDNLVDWLWAKLQSEFGFHPPATPE